jgi:hypothetical protein
MSLASDAVGNASDQVMLCHLTILLGEVAQPPNIVGGSHLCGYWSFIPHGFASPYLFPCVLHPVLPLVLGYIPAWRLNGDSSPAPRNLKLLSQSSLLYYGSTTN